jgi:hypothetical protein
VRIALAASVLTLVPIALFALFPGFVLARL